MYFFWLSLNFFKSIWSLFFVFIFYIIYFVLFLGILTWKLVELLVTIINGSLVILYQIRIRDFTSNFALKQ
jgi:hypothetical protein